MFDISGGAYESAHKSRKYIMKTHYIDGMTLNTYSMYPKDISIPKAIKICLKLLAVATLIELAFGGEQIALLLQASNGVVFAGLLAWN